MYVMLTGLKRAPCNQQHQPPACVAALACSVYVVLYSPIEVPKEIKMHNMCEKFCNSVLKLRN